MPYRGAKFHQPCLIENIVLIAVGHNHRRFFACHHEKNVFRESDLRFKIRRRNWRHRRLITHKRIQHCILFHSKAEI